MSQSIFLVSLVLVSQIVFAAGKANVKECKIQMPHSRKGCEGECCGLSQKPLRSASDQDVFERPEVNAKKIGFLRKGDLLLEKELILVTRQPGELRVADNSVEFKKAGLKKGDVVVYLSYDSEGSRYVCIGEREISLGWESEFEQIKDRVVEQWTKVKTSDGLTGYVLGIAFVTREAC